MAFVYTFSYFRLIGQALRRRRTKRSGKKGTFVHSKSTYLINSRNYYTIHSFFICYWINDEAAMFHNKTNKWSREKEPIAYNSFRLVVNWIESERCMWTEHKNKDIEWARARARGFGVECTSRMKKFFHGPAAFAIFSYSKIQRIKCKKEKPFHFTTNEREWMRGSRRRKNHIDSRLHR